VRASAGKTVLVVDDERELRELIVDVFSGEGYDVLAASDGVEALQLLGSLSCTQDCVVVSDLQMPRMSGRALLRAIRADQRLGHLRVLIVSSDALRDELADADAILPKPFEPTTLTSIVAELFAM